MASPKKAPVKKTATKKKAATAVKKKAAPKKKAAKKKAAPAKKKTAVKKKVTAKKKAAPVVKKAVTKKKTAITKKATVQKKKAVPGKSLVKTKPVKKIPPVKETPVSLKQKDTIRKNIAEHEEEKNIMPAEQLSLPLPPPEEKKGVKGIINKLNRLQPARNHDPHHFRLNKVRKGGPKPSGKKPLW